MYNPTWWPMASYPCKGCLEKEEKIREQLRHLEKTGELLTLLSCAVLAYYRPEPGGFEPRAEDLIRLAETARKHVNAR